MVSAYAVETVTLNLLCPLDYPSRHLWERDWSKLFEMNDVGGHFKGVNCDLHPL